MLYGLLNLSFWGYVIAAIVMIQISYACITVYLHRCQAHRALDVHPIVSHFCRFWLWLTTGMQTKEWVAIHRKHHAKCETVDDPHSPQILGIRKVLLQGAELYRAAKKDPEIKQRYGQGTPDDWIERNLYTRYTVSGLILMLLIDVVLFGIPGITIWAFQAMATPLGAAGVINGIGHFWGYRNFECDDAARNVFPLGIFFAGEELHNNHHTFASSAKLSVHWWEFDIGWFYIRCLQMLRLAKVKKIPPKLERVANKMQIDIDTLKVIVNNRFQVLAHYSRDVILPVLREERRKAGNAGSALLQRAKTLLIRTDSLLDDPSRERIAEVLKQHQALQLVYQYRLKLQAIWTRTTASQRELLDALHQWCKEAEGTGIATLRQFAARLRGYTLGKI